MAQFIKDDEVVGFQQDDNIDRLSSKLGKRFRELQADSAVIAKMPEIGEEVEINGIKFFVQDYQTDGKVILEPKGKQ